jgi:hypothetical protein
VFVDGHRLDRIARSLVTDVSRRQGLRVLASGLTAVVVTALGWRNASAESVDLGGVVPEDADRTCRREPVIDNKQCPSNGCTRDRECFCFKTVNGKKRCARANNQRLRCPTRDECERNNDCTRGRICAEVGGCCGRPNFHACLEVCR